MIKALTRHWPKYLMEGIELGDFMIAACIVATLLDYPASSVRQAITAPFSQYVLIGLAIGLTAIGIMYLPYRATPAIRIRARAKTGGAAR